MFGATGYGLRSRGARRALLAGAMICGWAAAASGHAQTAASTTPSSPPAKPQAAPQATIVVTGSRIARVSLNTPQPIAVITAQDIKDRGYTNLADMINQLPAAGQGVTPIGSQNDFGVGRNYIDLFSLGSNRTLTLVDGLRFVGDNPSNIFANEGGTQVDINDLPTLLVDRIDMVPATGAAVYGSDAVSGVVNIIMRKRFTGAEFTAQTGISTYGDAPKYSAEGAVGGDFFDGRVNLAMDFQYDHTNPISAADRSWTADQLGFVSNPAYTAPDMGQAAQIIAPNIRFSGVTAGGLPLDLNGNLINLPGTSTPVQFAKNGSLVAFNQGNLYADQFIGGNASGGDSLNLAPETQLQTPLDRKVFMGMMDFDITPHVNFHANVYLAQSVALEGANQPNYADAAFGASPAYNQPAPGAALLISSQNAFLTPQAQQVLAADGIGDFYLSRANIDVTPDAITAGVTTLNASAELRGDFTFLDRDFNWSTSVVRGVAWSTFDEDYLDYGNSALGLPSTFGYALDSVIGANGQPECRVKAQNPNSTDPNIANCLPFNPFGVGNNSQAVLNYITADFGNRAKNAQTDIQADMGGTVIKLPAGDLKTNFGYEYREEEAVFSPNLASEEGIGYSVPISGQIGAYHTNELYGEMVLPILGPGFNWAFAQRFQMEGAYRYVWNSLAGYNKSWQFGGEFSPVPDITLRGSRSETFRDPSLQELFSASTSAFDDGPDPCQLSNITAGPNPSAREANCAKAFAALGANLSTFTDSTVSNFTIPVTASGNPKLKNEVGESYTYGVAIKPRWVPGLTASADYVVIDITNAIEYFGVGALMEACYDSPTYPSTPCNDFTRQPGTGQVVSANETFVNAGFTHFTAVTYTLDYQRRLNQLPFVSTSHNLGSLDVSVSGVNTRQSINSFSGLGYDDINSAGTVGTSSSNTSTLPRWRWTGTATWSRDPWRVTWTTNYISAVAYDLTLTPSDQEPLKIPDNVVSDLSVAYKITPWLTARLNVDNVFNQAPPAPVGTYSYGYYDFIGRYFLLGLDGKF